MLNTPQKARLDEIQAKVQCNSIKIKLQQIAGTLYLNKKIMMATLQQHDLQLFRQNFRRPWPKNEGTYIGFKRQNGVFVNFHVRRIQNPFLRFRCSGDEIEIYLLENLDKQWEHHIGYWSDDLAKQMMPLLQAKLISLMGRLENSELFQTKQQMKTQKLEASNIKEIGDYSGGTKFTMTFKLHLSLKSKSFKQQNSPFFKEEESFFYKYVTNYEKVYEHYCKCIRQIDMNSREILQLGKQKACEQQNQNEDISVMTIKNYRNNFELFAKNFNFPETKIDSLKLQFHQRQALTWLLYREGAGGEWRPVNHNNLIWKEYKTQKNQTFYFCPYTGQNSLQKESFTGGILNDDNGFDEKLTMIALILRNPKPQGVQRIKTTLIVTNNQMTNWSQILEQTNLTVLVLQNDQAAVNFQNYDVVIISYYAIMQDWKIVKENWRKGIIDPELKSIYDYQYYRVILDQASKIKNYKTLRAQACLNLDTHYRWCVTSQSLIQNSFDDLIVLLQFINQKQMPCPNAWWFHKYITGPYQQNQRAIQEFIRDITVPSLILRRTQQSTYPNGKLMITLPVVQFKKFMIAFTPDERKAYEIMKDQLGGEGCCYSQKLRKICDYSQMSDIRPAVNRISQRKLVWLLPNHTPEQRAAFEHEVLDLKIRCQVCEEPDQIFKVSNCRHQICKICYRKRKNNNNLSDCHFPQCPNHNTRYISIKYTLSEEWKKTYVRPSKIIIIRQILNDIPQGDKCVIFTQFIEMIEVLIHDLRRTDNPITCYVLNNINQFIHGAMPHVDRQIQLNQFNQAQEKVVLVASLKANEGQDLTRAKHIIFVEPWWNYAVQDQAIQRVKVNERGFSPNQAICVHKLITKDTIEVEIAQANEKKRSLIGIYNELDMDDSSDSDSD